MIDNLLAFARADRESGALKLTTFPLDDLPDDFTDDLPVVYSPPTIGSMRP